MFRTLLVRPALAIVALAATVLAHHPHDIIQVFALSPDFARDSTVVVGSPGSMNVMIISRDGGLTWKPFHVGLRGTSYQSLEFAPDWATSGTIYAGTREGGFQVSRDFGRTWETPLLSMRGAAHRMAVGPITGANGQHAVFASMYGWRVMRSDDHGRTFRNVFMTPGRAQVVSIAISPTFAQDQTVLVGTDDGQVHMSTDGGANWASFTAPAPAHDIALSPNFVNDRFAWFATWGQGVQIAQLRSGLGPRFFRGAGITDDFVNDVEVVPNPGAPATPNVLYAATKDDGVFATVNAGIGWARVPLSVDLTKQGSSHFLRVRASRNWHQDRRVFCGTFEGFRLGFDHGTKWLETHINPTRIGRQVDVSPNYASDRTVFATGYGMASQRTEDGGASWTPLGINIRTTSIYEVEISPNYATHPMVLAGVNHGLRVSEDGGQTWRIEEFQKHPRQSDPHGLPVWVIRDIAFSDAFTTDNRIFAVSAVGVVYESTDGGQNWGFASVNPIPSGNIRTLALSPNFSTDSTMFAAGYPALYVSTDAGQNFTAGVAGNFKEDTLLIPDDLASTGEFFVVDSNEGFMIVTQMGAQAIPSNTGLDGYKPTAVRLSPDFVNDGTIYATTTGAGVYASRDRGRTWSALGQPSSIIANASTFALSPDFLNDKTMYAGVFDGHAKSTDGGVTWTLTTNLEVYDDRRDPWAFQGNWSRRSRPGSNRYGVTQSSDALAAMILPFDGHGIRVHGTLGPSNGRLDIILDGAVVKTIDTYAPTAVDRAMWFERQNLTPGFHILEIQVRADKNEASTGFDIGVDDAQVRY